MKKFLMIVICLFLLLFTYCKYNNMNINDIGLSLLSWVKKIKGDAVDLKQINKKNSEIMKHDSWSVLLRKYVTENGQVNYKGFLQDNESFQEYLDKLSLNPPGENWSKEEQLAYWINAYNAYTVKLIIDNYPLKSIKTIGDGLPMVNSPWDIKFFKIGGVDFDLNTIEHEILRKKYNEPRIHFAINCASVSCPKLRNEAFTAEELHTQLDDQANAFINNTSKNKFTDNEISLSKIFNWFESDFIKEKPLDEFLKKYKTINNFKDAKIGYLDYDWNLNE